MSVERRARADERARVVCLFPLGLPVAVAAFRAQAAEAARQSRERDAALESAAGEMSALPQEKLLALCQRLQKGMWEERERCAKAKRSGAKRIEALIAQRRAELSHRTSQRLVSSGWCSGAFFARRPGRLSAAFDAACAAAGGARRDCAMLMAKRAKRAIGASPAAAVQSPQQSGGVARTPTSFAKGRPLRAEDHPPMEWSSGEDTRSAATTPAAGGLAVVMEHRGVAEVAAAEAAAAGTWRFPAPQQSDGPRSGREGGEVRAKAAPKKKRCDRLLLPAPRERALLIEGRRRGLSVFKAFPTFFRTGWRGRRPEPRRGGARGAPPEAAAAAAGAGTGL